MTAPSQSCTEAGSALPPSSNEDDGDNAKLVATIRDEMMVAMLDTLQMAAASCSDVCVTRLQRLRTELLDHVKEAQEESERSANSTDGIAAGAAAPDGVEKLHESIRKRTSIYDLCAGEEWHDEGRVGPRASFEAMYDSFETVGASGSGSRAQRPSLGELQRLVALSQSRPRGESAFSQAAARSGMRPSMQQLEGELGGLSRLQRVEAELSSLKANSELQGQLRELREGLASSEAATRKLGEEVRAQLTSLSWQLSGMWEIILGKSRTPGAHDLSASSPKQSGRAQDQHSERPGRAIGFKEGGADEQAIAVSGKMRSSKTRQATAFVRPDPSQGVGFADEDSESEQEVDGRNLRSTKARQATAFVPARATDGINFEDEDVEEVEVAQGAKLRSTKTRQATSFVPKGASVLGGSVSFADGDLEEVEVAPGTKMRSAKTRQATAFAPGPQHSLDQDGAISFADENVEELPVEPGASLRPSKGRQATAFVPKGRSNDVEEDEEWSPSREKRIHFQGRDSVREIPACSDNSGQQVKLRSAKGRQATGFVAPGSAVAQGIAFAEEDSESEQEVEKGSKLRSAKNRQATAFAPRGANQDDDDEPKRVVFKNRDSFQEFDPDVGLAELQEKKLKPVKTRQATTFVPPKRGQGGNIQFAEEHSEEEQEVDNAAGAKLRPAKGRQATAFVPQRQADVEDDEENSGRQVQFGGAEVSVQVPASQMRPTKTRQATAFVPPGAHRTAAEGDGVSFAEDHSESDQEVASSAKLRPSKTRQATAFVKKAPMSHEMDEDDDEDETGKRVGFQNSGCVEEVAASGEMRPTKARQATAFVPKKRQDVDEEDDENQPRRVNFRNRESVQEFDPAGDYAVQRNLRSAKTRQATAFVQNQQPEDDEDAEEDGAAKVGFGNGGVEMIEPSESKELGAKKMRSAKTRQATAFVPQPKDEDDDEDDGARVGFNDDEQTIDPVEGQLNAAKLRPTKSRQATAFVAKLEPKDDDDDDEGGVSFADQQLVSVTERPAEGEMRSSKKRQPTAFVKPATSISSSGGVSFADDVEVSDISENEIHGEVTLRPTRNRQATSFVSMSSTHSIDMEDSDGDDAQDGGVMTHVKSNRPERLRLPTKFDGHRRGSMSDVSDIFDDDAVFKKHVPEPKPAMFQAVVETEAKSPMEGPVTPPDIMKYVVPSDGAKDTELIQSTLKSLYFFNDLHESGIKKLIDAMELFVFDAGADVTRQGNKQGTHFFIVEQGSFAVIKDGKEKVLIDRGQAFGESVILLSGAQNATVRAKEASRCYGMSGVAVRQIFKNQYDEEHNEVIKAVNSVLHSDYCYLLRRDALTNYQHNILYDKAHTRDFNDGDVLMKEGDADEGLIHVLLKGSLSLRQENEEVFKLPPGCFGLVGDDPLLFNSTTQVPINVTVIAEGAVQTLALTRELLEEMFGSTSQLKQVLMKNRISSALMRHEAFRTLPNDQLEAIIDLAKIPGTEDYHAGEQIDIGRASFAVGLLGDFDVAASCRDTKIVMPSPCRLRGIAGDVFGDPEVLMEHGGTWVMHATPIPYAKKRDGVFALAYWLGETLAHKLRKFKSKKTIVGPDDQLDENGKRRFKDRTPSIRIAMMDGNKQAVLKKVVVFRTLKEEQLTRLADSLSVVKLFAGETLFEQGDEGHEFFLIQDGHLKIIINGNVIRTIGMGDYLGERALMFNETRTASAVAMDDCELWKMGSEAFNDVVQGPIVDYMKDRIAFQNTRLELDDLTCMRIVGRGGFGLVKMVTLDKTGTRYALKAVSKKHAIEQQQQEALVRERNILADVDHPFIYKFVRSFQGPRYVYFLIELVTGGELLDALQILGLLKKPQAQFYVASIALVLEFLHERRIAYLDLKGENCLLDHHGYLKMVDFGIAERVTNGRLHVVKGTPMFMAPEVLKGTQGYTTSADLWSLGVVLFDFMLGVFPFGDDAATQTEIFRAIMRKPPAYPKTPVCEASARKMIDGLLTKDPICRLGAGPSGYDEIKSHSFFEGFQWDGLLARQLQPPCIPKKETYAEDQENPNNIADGAKMTARMEDDVEGDGWVDPNPEGWEDF